MIESNLANAPSGRPQLGEIDRLTEQYRRTGDLQVLSQLVWARHAAFPALRDQAPAPIAAAADPFPSVAGRPPEVAAAAVTPELVRGALQHHGSLLVRGLFSAAACRRLIEDIDASLAAATGGVVGLPWWLPFEPPDISFPPGGRNWVVANGTLYTADSPRTLFDLIDVLQASGVGELVTAYLGERPALTLEKCAVRRVVAGPPTGWHQDGRFLGAGARVINVWAALSPCGRNAPSLEIVPRRFDDIVRTGTAPGFDWVVGQDVVDEVARDCPPVLPEFAAGDALLFDEMLLHRTARDMPATEPRYSIEAWFFAPSTYPQGKWVPLAF
jgi:hypothetical protein